MIKSSQLQRNLDKRDDKDATITTLNSRSYNTITLTPSNSGENIKRQQHNNINHRFDYSLSEAILPSLSTRAMKIDSSNALYRQENAAILTDRKAKKLLLIDDHDDSTSLASSTWTPTGYFCTDISLRVIFSLARRDVANVLLILSLFPLKFKDEEFEHRYAEFVGQTFPPRIRRGVAIFQLLQIFIFWSLLGFAMAINVAETSTKATVQSIRVFASGVFYLIPSFASLRRHCEASVCVVYVVIITLPLVSTLLASVAAVTMTSVSFLKLYEFKHWTDTISFGIASLSIFTLGTVYRTRTRYSGMVHIWFWLLPVLVSITQSVMIEQQIYQELSSIVNSIEVFLLTVTIMLGYWDREVQERVEYVEHLKRTDKLNGLQELHRERRKAQTSTAAEDLIGLLQKSHRLLSEAVLLSSSMNDGILEAKCCIKEALNIIKNTSSLYQVHVGTEAGSEQQKFLNIYSNPRDALSTGSDLCISPKPRSREPDASILEGKQKFGTLDESIKSGSLYIRLKGKQSKQSRRPSSSESSHADLPDSKCCRRSFCRHRSHDNWHGNVYNKMTIKSNCEGPFFNSTNSGSNWKTSTKLNYQSNIEKHNKIKEIETSPSQSMKYYPQTLRAQHMVSSVTPQPSLPSDASKLLDCECLIPDNVFDCYTTTAASAL